jgi:hypothetical protein
MIDLDILNLSMTSKDTLQATQFLKILLICLWKGQDNRYNRQVWRRGIRGHYGQYNNGNAKKVIDSIREKFFGITHTALGHEFNVSFQLRHCRVPDFSLAETISEAVIKPSMRRKNRVKTGL